MGISPRMVSPQHEKFLFRKVETSAFMTHGGSERGVVDDGQGAGPAEGSAGNEETTHYAEAGSGRAGTERAGHADCAMGKELKRRPLPIAHPHPGGTTGSFYCAQKRKFLFCVDSH